MEVIKNGPEPQPVPPVTYNIVGLTEAQFDVIVGCLHVGEYGGDPQGDGLPIKMRGQVYSGIPVGGALVFSEIPRSLRDAAIRRLER